MGSPLLPPCLLLGLHVDSLCCRTETFNSVQNALLVFIKISQGIFPLEEGKNLPKAFFSIK